MIIKITSKVIVSRPIILRTSKELFTSFEQNNFLDKTKINEPYSNMILSF